jgi:hypothetical protein
VKVRRKETNRKTKRQVDGYKMDLSETGCGGTDWIDLAQDKDYLRVSGSMKCLEILE